MAIPPTLQMVTHPAALRCPGAAWEEVDILLAENVRSEESKFALIIPYLLEVLSILNWLISGMQWNRDTIALPVPSPTPVLEFEPQCCKKKVKFCYSFSVDTNQEFWRKLWPKYI